MTGKEHELPIGRVTFLELLQDPNFDTACLAILLDGTDNLDSNALIGLNVDCFDNFAKSSLTKQANRAIWSCKDEFVGRNGKYKKPTALIDYVIWGDNVMTLFIIAGDLLLRCLSKSMRSEWCPSEN